MHDTVVIMSVYRLALQEMNYQLGDKIAESLENSCKETIMLAQKPERKELPSDYHHPLSASTSYRWMPCAKSVKANAGIEKKQNEAAAFGSLVHEYAARLYTDKVIHFELNQPANMQALRIAENYLDLLHPLIDGADLIKIEERVYLDTIAVTLYDVLSGTVDAAAVTEFGKLVVVDLKTGYRDVPVRDNSQLLYYALGVYSELDEFVRSTIVDVDIIIIQINDRFGAQLKVHTISINELLEFEKELQAAVINVETNPDSAVAGDWCEYCAIALTCEANLKHQSETLGTNLAVYDPGIQLPMPRDIARFLQVVPALKKQIAVLEDKALKLELDNPGTIPGWKAITKFGHRQWVDKAKVCEMATQRGISGTMIMETNLKSPAQVEKICRDLVNSETVIKPSTGFRLVERDKDEIDNYLEGE